MFTNGALKQLIAMEEKKPDHGQLVTSAYDTDEFFVPAPFEWQLGLLFVGVLNTNHERVLVFMYVGAVDDNRLCVTIDHTPIPLSITTVSLQQAICKFSKSYNRRANRELMYVPTLLITRQGMLPVIPLLADQVATCFDKGGSFKSVRDLFHMYDEQTAPMEKTRNCLFKDWLRAALLSGNDDNSRSQLEIAPAIPAQFTLDQSTMIYSDVGEAFHQGDEDNTFGKLVAEGIRNTFSPAFNPTGPPAEEDDVGPDKGRVQHPPTTITPLGGSTNPATTPATAPAPAPATLPTTTNATQFPATTPVAPTSITPSTTQPEESKVQVLGTRQRVIAFDPTLEQQQGVGNGPLNGQQQGVGNENNNLAPSFSHGSLFASTIPPFHPRQHPQGQLQDREPAHR
jgi:hypothetical protein